MTRTDQLTTEIRTLGELAKSEYFGIWKDRGDIEDSSSFVQDLRRRAWRLPADEGLDTPAGRI